MELLGTQLVEIKAKHELVKKEKVDLQQKFLDVKLILKNLQDELLTIYKI